jgi:hypothetical protein
VSADHYSKVWSSLIFEAWSDDMRNVAIYLIAGPHRRTHGLYRLPLAYGAPDLDNPRAKWSDKRFRVAFDDLVHEGFCEYDEEAQIVLIVKSLKRNKPNDNQIVGICREFGELPPTPLRKRFIELAETYAPKLYQSLSKGFPDLCKEA